MNETDKADLERADAMVRGGKKLRQQVLARIRQRAWREREKEKRRREEQ